MTMRRREFAKSLAASGISMMVAGRGAAASATEVPMPPKPKPGLDWMERAELMRHHLTHGVDGDGLPYFDVLLRGPYAEMAHSYPDSMDVTSRNWEGAMMVGEITGRGVATEALFARRASGLLSKTDGLAYNPATRFSYHRAEVASSTRLLFALIRRAEREPSAENRRAVLDSIRAVRKIAPSEGDVAWLPSMVYMGDGKWENPLPGPGGDGFGTALFIRPLTEASVVLGDQEPLDFARRLVNGLRLSGEFAEDGRWTGHVHAHLDGIAGIIECGMLTGDRSMIDWGGRAFEFIRRLGTEFGWIPELIDRNDDCVGCETCAVMDYVDAAILLARSGRHDLWDLVERVTRNQLVESQIFDPAWLPEPPGARDDEVTVQRQVGRRMVGAFAGWSSPIGLLAYDETYWKGSWERFGPGPWDHIESGRIRAVQNCCAASGFKGLYRSWRATARVEGKTLVVEMPFDRSLPEATIIARQPFGDAVTITAKSPIKVKFRLPQEGKPALSEDEIPGAIAPPAKDAVSLRRSLKANKNGQPVILPVAQGYVTCEGLQPGEKLEISYQRSRRIDHVSIGNPGYQFYSYKARWYGATVTRMEPLESNPTEGWNKIMKRQTRVYMKGQVPHRIYQRADWT
jgi:hypothetical protein